MRCLECGWIIGESLCRCGGTSANGQHVIPKGTRVLARPGHGPSLYRWEEGSVIGLSGPLYQIETRHVRFWCNADDLLPLSPRDDFSLPVETRVWAWCLDGRWYPGQVDGQHENLRHVQWDDGDAMWIEASHAVVMAVETQEPEVGLIVLAQHWDGDYQLARVEQQEGEQFRVTFGDEADTWIGAEDIQTFPPNPFHDFEGS